MARDVRMIERGEDGCLALEAREPIRIAREELRQYLQRDIATELSVARAIDFPHTAGAKGPDNLVGAEASAGRKRHCGGTSEV